MLQLQTTKTKETCYNGQRFLEMLYPEIATKTVQCEWYIRRCLEMFLHNTFLYFCCTCLYNTALEDVCLFISDACNSKCVKAVNQVCCQHYANHPNLDFRPGDKICSKKNVDIELRGGN